MKKKNKKVLKKVKNKYRVKINYQKIFCVISIGFVLACIIYYGTRFILLYIENKNEKETSINTLAQIIINNNYGKETFTNINSDYYFQNEADTNYLEYSNILWRIIKVKSNKEIVLISENTLTSLAYGENTTYVNSYINKWLNYTKDKTGILENNLNDVSTYLNKNETCIDTLSKITSETCQEVYSDNYIGLLSTADYVNTGAENSFVNNDTKFYLSNTNEDGQVWYITDTNKISYSDGTDLIGIKAVITLKSDINLVSGNGTSASPYTIENDKSLLGSYVKLGKDIWQVYSVNDDTVNLVLNNLLTKDDEVVEYIYAKSGYAYNTSKSNTLAYYLNHTYLNSLSYKDIIIKYDYVNGYYGADNDYDYMSMMNTTVSAYVGLLNVSDIKLNHELNGYFQMTGNTKNGSLIYVEGSNGTIYMTSASEENYILPTITIEKDILIKGEGTLASPYEVE